METLRDLVEENDNRFELFSKFVKGNRFCEYAEMLGGCSECPCNIHDGVRGDGDMECALDRVQSMLEAFDTELNERQMRETARKYNPRKFPDVYNVH